MVSLTGITRERADEIYNASVVEGRIDNGQLLLKTRGGQEFVAGSVATKASVLEAVYPVGAMYISTTNVNPNTLLGIGTWVSVGAGRALMGVDPNDSSMSSAKQAGGSKTKTLTLDNLPSHTHSFDQINLQASGGASVSSGNGSENAGLSVAQGSTSGRFDHPVKSTNQSMTPVGKEVPDPIDLRGPYYTVYFWNRTA